MPTVSAQVAPATKVRVAAVTREVAQVFTSPEIDANIAELGVIEEVRVPPYFVISMRVRTMSLASLKMIANVRSLMRKSEGRFYGLEGKMNVSGALTHKRPPDRVD